MQARREFTSLGRAARLTLVRHGGGPTGRAQAGVRGGQRGVAPGEVGCRTIRCRSAAPARGLRDREGTGAAPCRCNRRRSSSSQPPAEIRVGLLLPLTGPAAGLAQDMLDAAQMALFDVGANDLILLPRDTAGTPEGARQAAEQVIAEGAAVILGPLFNQAVSAVNPIAAAADVRVLAFSNVASAGGARHLPARLPPGGAGRARRPLCARQRRAAPRAAGGGRSRRRRGGAGAVRSRPGRGSPGWRPTTPMA